MADHVPYYTKDQIPACTNSRKIYVFETDTNSLGHRLAKHFPTCSTDDFYFFILFFTEG